MSSSKSKQSKSKIPSMTVKKIMSDEEVSKIQGSFLDIDPKTYKVITSDIDVYTSDGYPLLHFRKNAINDETSTTAFKTMKKAGKVKNNNRGIASGKFDMEEFLKTHKTISKSDIKVQNGGFTAYCDFKKGKTGKKSSVANYANSGVAGWMDQPNRMRREEGGCRLTSFSSKHMKMYEQNYPFFQRIDTFFKTLEPDLHANQLKRTLMTKAQVSDTAFSTITINYNWRTALHKDKGDYNFGFGCFTVCENLENKESFGGCELMFPQYGIAVDVRHGDILLFDSHQWHCNNSADFQDHKKERLSFVCYLKVNMLSACTKNKPFSEKTLNGVKIQYRPDSKDEGAFEDVCKKKIYRNKLFKIDPSDVWLDCGAHIGCFSLWALKQGARKVISVEANPSNLELLQRNMYLNLQEKNMIVVHGAVRYVLPDKKEQLLYEAKSSRRHTTFPVRGRSSIPIPYYKFEKFLKPGVNAVKLNIQGDEREIIKNVRDWKNVNKLVFEYHFTKTKNGKYNSFEVFHDIMDNLRLQGFEVLHKKLAKTGEPNYFPADTIVYCLRK